MFITAATSDGSQYLENVTGTKDGNVLFNDALETLYLWLYNNENMVKNQEQKLAATTSRSTLLN